MARTEIQHRCLDCGDVANWLKQPHVAEFWQETEDEEEFRRKFLSELPERGVAPFIVAVDSRPIGFIQYYDACKVGGGWWPDAQEGTFGIDQFIGDPSMIGRGLGTEIIKQFVGDLFANKAVRETNTPGGVALLMRLERSLKS